MIGGMGLSVSSISWMGIWMGMEISLLGIYGVFCGNFSQNEIMASLKYFMIQALSANLILMGFLFRDWGVLSSVWGELVVYFAIFLKVGVFPFYYWVMPVMSGLSWPASWLFCTLQKIIPLMAFSVMLESFLVLGDICALLSVMLGGIEGMRQNSIRGIFAFSSIGQSGWLLLLCGRGDSMSVVMFSVFYSVILMTVFWSFFKYDPYSFSFMNVGFLSENFLKVYNVVVVFSLMGLPPLCGFIPKVLVLCEVGFSLGMFSLLLLWAVLAAMWFYSSFLFCWMMESYGSYYFFGMSKFLTGKLDNLMIFLFFSFNLWGGLLYFLWAMGNS
uniref:NADH dehydrogenase subunit 2 n=1 Tax=Thyasira tokunagai TaxID=3055801 RepID=UPI0030FEF719